MVLITLLYGLYTVDMCGAKGYGFLSPFWFESGYTFNHSSLKSGNILYTLPHSLYFQVWHRVGF